MFSRLYIHIPFCRKKCPYCTFFSRELSEGDLDYYSEMLLREMSLVAENMTSPCTLESIYFGGGTPSLMDGRQIGRLIEKAGQTFGLTTRAEITLEANPGTVDFNNLLDFRKSGINRLSLGIQSFDDRMLAALGRIHSAEEARSAFSAARRAGFNNIGIDLINSLPGQNHEMWQSDLEQALQLAPDHVSVYGLIIEEDTGFAAQYAPNNPLLPDEETGAEMFEAADDLLVQHGYEHYEIANYARPGFRSQHNCGYWHRDGYLGLGTGAHSFIKVPAYGNRFSNVSNLDEYVRGIRNDDLPRHDRMELTREDAMAEHMFLGLRMSDGVNFDIFEREFGIKLKDVFGEELLQLQLHELLAERDGRVHLTRRGMLLSNHVFQKFLP